MKRAGIIFTIGVTGFALTVLGNLPILASDKTDQVRANAKLVDETLRREAVEGVKDRGELLKPAREQSPDCKEAYWQSGFIRDAKLNLWLSPEEVEQYAGKDEQLAAYRETREKFRNTENDQAELARWCMRHKLDDQARAHWMRVLNFAPDHPDARKQLGFRQIDGKWLTSKEAAEKKTVANNFQAALRQWSPKLEALSRKLEGTNRRDSEAARQDLKAIKDPEVAPAIGKILCEPGGDGALLGCEILRNFVTPLSASVLAWHAAYSPWEATAEAAAKALGKQDKLDYVPLLLDAAETSINRSPQVSGNSDDSENGGISGTSARTQIGVAYRLVHGTSTQEWVTNEKLKEHPRWQDIPGMRYDPKTPETVAKRTTTQVGEGGNNGKIYQKEYFTVRNDRIQNRVTQNRITTNWERLAPVGTFVAPQGYSHAQLRSSQMEETPSNTEPQNWGPLRALAEATGEKRPKTVSEWWRWWYDYNEVFIPADPLQKAEDKQDTKAVEASETQAQRGDCLAGETLVATETGLVAIEKVAIGDRIFCCDIETGCLALKPVLRKTVRPEGKLLKIHAGGEDFEASGGHVFWVAGIGWLKARDLRPEMQLHTLRGTMPVESVELGSSQESFSLVAADFHAFFVGKGMALTHDNTIRSKTDRIVPGLSAEKKFAPAGKIKREN